MKLILTMFPFADARSLPKDGEWQHNFVAKIYKWVKKKRTDVLLLVLDRIMFYRSVSG